MLKSICMLNYKQLQQQADLEALRGVQVQLVGPSQQLLHGRSQLIAVGKQLSPAKDIKAQPGPGEGHYQPPHIPDVPYCPGAHQ